jgi:RimJ/RimL family protein N-acetyltransferase
VGTVVAESKRLILRHWEDDDVDQLARLGTPEVVRFLGGVPWTPGMAREALNLYRSIEDSLGLTIWAVELKADQRLIGTCGYARTNVAWLRYDFVVEIGWTLGQPWWGKGLATEAASAVLPLGRDRFGGRRIISKCALANVASERVMHRIGMKRVGVVQGLSTGSTVLCRFP